MSVVPAGAYYISLTSHDLELLATYMSLHTYNFYSYTTKISKLTVRDFAKISKPNEMASSIKNIRFPVIVDPSSKDKLVAN